MSVIFSARDENISDISSILTLIDIFDSGIQPAVDNIGYVTSFGKKKKNQKKLAKWLGQFLLKKLE